MALRDNNLDPMKEPFLSPDGFSTDEVHDKSENLRGTYSRIFFLVPFVLNIVLFATLVWASRSGSTSWCDVYGINSPAQQVLEPQQVIFSGGSALAEDTYKGLITSERNQAWEDLYSFGISRIPESFAAKLPQRTSPLAGDPGYYVVELAMFHQLHCLNKLRLRLWSNSTYDGNHGRVGMVHLSHCLDEIRQALMCQADITPISYQWDVENKELTPISPTHTCRNFEKIWQWGKENEAKSFNGSIHVEGSDF